MRFPVRMLSLVAVLAVVGCKKEVTPPAEKAPEAPAPAAKADTPRVDTNEYTVTLNARANGGEIVITAKPPLHVNPDYPASFRPEAGGAKFASEKVPLTADVKKPCEAKAEDTCEASAPLAWEGGPGSKVAGIVQFSVCEPEKCLIEKVRLAATVP